MPACVRELPRHTNVRARRVGQLVENDLRRRWPVRLRTYADSCLAMADDGSTEILLRRCARCGLLKSASDFHDSITGQFSYCRECRRAYDRRYYRERGRTARLGRQRARVRAERAWMSSLKEGVACADCGQVFPPWVMHWDHLPGHEKVACISELVGSRRRAITFMELEQCELVCANCHVLRTVGRGSTASV